MTGTKSRVTGVKPVTDPVTGKVTLNRVSTARNVSDRIRERKSTKAKPVPPAKAGRTS